MCSCPNPAGQWTKQLRPWTSWNRGEPEDELLRLLPARSLRVTHRLPTLRPLDHPAWVVKEPAPEWALVPESGGVHPARGVRDGDCDRVAGPEEVRHRRRHRSGRRAVPRRRAHLAQGAHSLPHGCRYRQEWGRGIWVEEAPVVGPAPAFLVVVCAASNGRASICAYCTCNTLGRLAAIDRGGSLSIKPTLM